MTRVEVLRYAALACGALMGEECLRLKQWKSKAEKEMCAQAIQDLQECFEVLIEMAKEEEANA